ncbi:hypothetical protein E2986_13231 [Frieseomelitta varia]|uniref:PiggyBac transposable element-derived protein domain-containing protein n=1 Tax=Frieseomelitta varia TaxID=561572 RepID=A0A833VNP1_9HYME|nr:hypothetical protein E2986_13231 [Frieseomelitta varia]
MCRDRYFSLLKMLHFTDIVGHTTDRLYKINEVVEMLRTSFNNTFQLYQRLCIDESLLFYKGCLSFKQSRFGIKSFLLCDCQTGYVQDIIIYCGASTTVATEYQHVGKPGNIVMSLLQPFLNKGHTVYLDNWFSSPTLFILLHEKDICMWNAYCLYKDTTKKQISMAKFHLQKYYKNHEYHRSGSNYPIRLTGRHFPSIYHSRKKNRKRRCVICVAGGVNPCISVNTVMWACAFPLVSKTITPSYTISFELWTTDYTWDNCRLGASRKMNAIRHMRRAEIFVNMPRTLNTKCDDCSDVTNKARVNILYFVSVKTHDRSVLIANKSNAIHSKLKGYLT